MSRVEDAPAGTGTLPPFLSFEYSPDTIRVRNANNPHEVRCFPVASDRPGVKVVQQGVVEMSGGPRVLRNAVNYMSECAARVLGFEASDFRNDHPELLATIRSSRIVPHQANGRIVDALIERLGIARERVVRTIYRYGNLSAASNLVALDHGVRHGTMERELAPDETVKSVRTAPHRIEKGDLVLLPSIGGGYLMGCVGFRMGYDGAA
jgi:3-oxoacyl-[acyl-carrier-protein] synthase III